MSSENEQDVLVVVSKLKSYIKETHGLNTAGEVPAVITKAVKLITEQAVVNAKKDGRKTLMERDFHLPLEGQTTPTGTSVAAPSIS